MCNNIILELKDLRKSFGSKEVLRGINLKVSKGSIIGYIGPNGVGKSTTVKLILGLVKGYSGEIRLFGEDILKLDEVIKVRLDMFQRFLKYMIV